jgi:hypothetical protein
MVMIIITGLGRCGTSILTKYLGDVGFGVGRNINWHDEARAGYELSTAYSINREMWNSYCKAGKPIDLDFDYRGPYWKCKYREAIFNVDKDEKQGKVEVIKDPRFTWNPELIEAWWTVRQDFKLIICHRDIKSIYDSRKALPPQYDDPKRLKLPEYKIDFADFYTRVLQLEIPYVTLFFPKFLQNFHETWLVLEGIGLKHDYDKGKKIWHDMMDRTLLDGRT